MTQIATIATFEGSSSEAREMLTQIPLADLCALGISKDAKCMHFVYVPGGVDNGQGAAAVRKLLKEEFSYWSAFSLDTIGTELRVRSVDKAMSYRFRSMMDDVIDEKLRVAVSQNGSVVHVRLVTPSGIQIQTEVWGVGAYHKPIDTGHVRLIGFGCLVYLWNGNLFTTSSKKRDVPTVVGSFSVQKAVDRLEILPTRNAHLEAVIHFLDGTEAHLPIVHLGDEVREAGRPLSRPSAAPTAVA